MLLYGKRFGGIIRVFARTPAQVAQNADQACKAALAMSNIEYRGRPLFSEILVLVIADKRYLDHDCGETVAVLREKLRGSTQIQVCEIPRGDIFCGALNNGVATLVRKCTDYVCVVSHGAVSYLTDEIAEQAVEAFYKGAKVVGVALNELAESILQGRVANTLAFWDAIALMSVGGFDLRASQPRKDDPSFPYMKGWSAQKGAEVFYPLAGTEEIIPLIRLVETFGPCIAPLAVAGHEWKVPDPITDRPGYERHLAKMGTKFERQCALAASVNADLSYIKGGVMKDYR